MQSPPWMGGRSSVRSIELSKPDPKEGEYERERRLRMEANQVELQRLGLGTMSGMLGGGAPAKKLSL